MSDEISKSKLYAEHILGYIFNKLRNHDQIIKNLHELKGNGWRKMKYARGLFDRSVGFLSSNEVNEEFIALIEPFHCELITCSKELFERCSGKYKMDYISCEELFEKCDIIIIQSDTNDYKEKITASLIDKIKNEALLVIASDNVEFEDDTLFGAVKSGRINVLLSEKSRYAREFSQLLNVMIMKI